MNVTSIDQSAVTVNTLIEYYSNWPRLKKAVAVFHRVQKILQKCILQREIVLHTDPDTFEQSITVQELLDAENALLKLVQLQQLFKDIQ